jgi:hypothetical protein
MFMTSVTRFPQETSYKDTYIELFMDVTKREVTSILREYGSGRFGIVENDLWFWRGDVFHSTVMQAMWDIGYYKQWTDWSEKLYFERYGEGVIWSTQPDFTIKGNEYSIARMQSAYPRMKEIRPGNSDKILWSR